MNRDNIDNDSSMTTKLGPYFPSVMFSSRMRKRKSFVLSLLVLWIIVILFFVSLYCTHHGFRRSVQFWKGAGPLALEYKFIKYKAKYMDGMDVDDIDMRPLVYQQRLKEFHIKTAPKVVTLIQNLGGIYVKIGQVISTLGSGILDENYINALRPLQDGVPARDYAQISSIIEKSTGKNMNDLFLHFEQTPIGSASIAQVHRATLRPLPSRSNHNHDNRDLDIPGQEVVVKVQYPEVADQFNADLNNLELLTKVFLPENNELIQTVRRRHENELDFRLEAQNLREVTYNMQQHGLEPSIIRIPRVRNETGICTQHVLAMEYLDGISLNNAITEEQNRFAKALGKSNADELRSMLNKRLRKHFERGGGSSDETVSIMDTDSHQSKVKILKIIGPFAASTFRFYANVKERVSDFINRARNFLIANPSREESMMKKRQHFNLAKIIKTLVYVHGIQMIKDGVFNADPHPGNCLIMPDGRLGLLDYGMVGRLSEEQRNFVANVIKALARKDKTEVARWYKEGGYKISFRRRYKKTEEIKSDDVNILHRFATFHFDKIDFSKVTIESGKKVDIIKLLHSINERAVPDWIEQGRRLGGLLIGVAVQTARPISLAKEWEPIASQALKQMKAEKKITL